MAKEEMPFLGARKDALLWHDLKWLHVAHDVFLRHKKACVLAEQEETLLSWHKQTGVLVLLDDMYSCSARRNTKHVLIRYFETLFGSVSVHLATLGDESNIIRTSLADTSYQKSQILTQSSSSCMLSLGFVARR